MAKETLPSTDNGLLAWSLNFKTVLNTAPSTYGVTTTELTTYGTLHSTYAAALEACDPGVRNKAAVVAKSQAKADLKANIRLLIAAVNRMPLVTDAMKIELGINVRATPTPIPAPDESPEIDIVSVTGKTVKIRLHRADAMKRGRPKNVAGAAVFSYVGATAPTDINAWHFEGNTTKLEVSVAFPESTAAGATVFLCAFWYNPRAQSGPACNPVSAVLQYGGVSAAAA